MGTHPIFESDFDCLTECVIICVDKMSFEVASAAGLEKFNKFLLDNSYVSGWTPTQKDVDIFKAIKSSPDGKYGNVLRWWKNISSYSSEFGSLAAGSAPAAAAEEDDDVDLFGSDDEEDDEEGQEGQSCREEQHHPRHQTVGRRNPAVKDGRIGQIGGKGRTALGNVQVCRSRIRNQKIANHVRRRR